MVADFEHNRCKSEKNQHGGEDEGNSLCDFR
ncbi:hypothetical protein GGQ84_000245 [Desulfitispora alkaliphila]